jgi:transposase
MADLSSLSLPLSRQQYTKAQKADIVEQSMAPGVSIASVAMAHGINANQLHKWRYLYKKGELGSMRQPSNRDALELLPVRLALDVPLHTKARPSSLPVPAPTSQTRTSCGYVELELGDHQLRIHGHVSTDALRSILQAIR